MFIKQGSMLGLPETAVGNMYSTPSQDKVNELCFTCH